ncbi:MAG: SPW repeat protein [Halobacteriaceae archaeon]
MATEQASTVATESGSLAKWASWLGALVGLWVVVSPFVLTGANTSSTVTWSNGIAGIVILVFSAFGAYTVRTSAETTTNSLGEWSGWIAAVTGLWILVSPFVLTGSITAGTAMWSTIVAGVIAFILAAYTGYHLHS